MAKGTRDPFTLFKLTDEIKALIADIADADVDGEDLESLYEELDSLYASRADKLVGYVKVIKNSLHASEGQKEIADLFDKRATALKNIAKRLKETLLADLEIHGEKSVTAGDFKIARQKNSVPTLDIKVDAEALPEAYQIVEIEADTDALREALKRGEQIDGASLEKGEHIRIRAK